MATDVVAASTKLSKILVLERLQLEVRTLPTFLVPLAGTVEHFLSLIEVDLHRTDFRSSPEASDLEVLVAIPVQVFLQPSSRQLCKLPVVLI